LTAGKNVYVFALPQWEKCKNLKYRPVVTRWFCI